MSVEQKEQRVLRWKELLFSKTLAGKNASYQVAYIAVMTAFAVVSNMFFEFKLADTQFSLTLAVSAVCGIVIGPLFGFVACFLGDLVGFLYHSAGFGYMPWIGLSMGLTAMIAGFVVNGLPTKGCGSLYLKLSVVCVLTFLLCTVAINTTAFWLLYAPTADYWAYLMTRLFVKGQIFNTLLNGAALFVFTPLLSRIKPLKIHL